MNDRYLYRAKRTDNGKWAEGHCITNEKDLKHAYIGYLFGVVDGMVHDTDIVEVIPSTICQCTGLKKFYEKDIVKRIDIHKVGDPSIGIIEYDVENTAFVIHWIDKQKYSPMYPWKDKIEVIGNIFDTPELLEVGE